MNDKDNGEFIVSSEIIAIHGQSNKKIQDEDTVVASIGFTFTDFVHDLVVVVVTKDINSLEGFIKKVRTCSDDVTDTEFYLLKAKEEI